MTIIISDFRYGKEIKELCGGVHFVRRTSNAEDRGPRAEKSPLRTETN
ncbi:MAG: hypothetical protein ABFD50_06955 [Smithella sp.]